MGEARKSQVIDGITYGECLQCGALFKEEEGGRPRKYCTVKCRKAFNRHIKSKSDQPHIKAAKALARSKLDDEVREVMREEVRASITQLVRDKVLGAAEVMVEALPTAMAQVIEDMHDPDVFTRQRAYALILRYAMPLMDEKGNDKDLGRITVVHQIPMPDTPLGEAVIDQLEVAAEEREDWRKEYKQCPSCKEMKHPDTFRGSVCTLCNVRDQVESGTVDPTAIARKPDATFK